MSKTKRTAICEDVLELVARIMELPKTRELSIAVTKLEEAGHWILADEVNRQEKEKEEALRQKATTQQKALAVELLEKMGEKLVEKTAELRAQVEAEKAKTQAEAAQAGVAEAAKMASTNQVAP